jgi:hypothetical protein
MVTCRLLWLSRKNYQTKEMTGRETIRTIVTTIAVTLMNRIATSVHALSFTIGLLIVLYLMAGR